MPAGPEARLAERPDGAIDYVLEVPCVDACYGAGAVTRLPDQDAQIAVLGVTVTHATGRMCAQTITIVRFAGTIVDARGIATVLFRITDERSGRITEVRAAI